MPNTKKEHEPDEKNPFIKQTIIEDKKARNKKAVSAACLAIVFGMVAGPSMALTSHRPLLRFQRKKLQLRVVRKRNLQNRWKT